MLKISVTIPSFNQGKYLEETIRSILDQNYQNLEIFIIDGGSTDNSVDIIKKYSEKITGWVSEKDSGQSEAINKGFKMSSGDIVSWLCSDDLYLPGTLKKVNEIFSSLPPSVGLIHGNSIIFNEERVVNYDKGYGNWNVERQLAGMTFPQPSSFMRRSYFERIGFINTAYHYGMDYELFSKMNMLSEFEYVDIYFSKYRLHQSSKSTTAISKFIDEWIIIFNSIVEGLKIDKIKKGLAKANLLTRTDDSIVNFFSGLISIRSLDHDKMLFYFLVNVFRFDYVSGKFSRAKFIGEIIKREYGNYLLSEPAIGKLIWRLNMFPPRMLQWARTVKGTFSNKFRTRNQTINQATDHSASKPVSNVPEDKENLNEPMRIGFVTSHINRSTQWIWFSEELQKRKIDHIHIILNPYKPLLYDDLKQLNVNVYYLKHTNPFYFIINFFKVVKLLREHKTNLVHTELPYGNFVGQLAALACKIPLRITTCENTTWFSDYDSKKQEVIDRLTYSLSKKVVALTQDSYEFLSKHFKIHPNKLRIIHHSINANDYLRVKDSQVDAMRAELGINKENFNIGMVARFERWKGHIYAVEAMKRLVAEFPNIRLYIFGSKGESYKGTMKLITKYNLGDYIIYKGFVHDNIVLFKIFDIHLHIPIKLRSETFGINILEGMISGCPQVLTLSGISTFTARDRKNCIIVPYESSDAVYHALKKLITDDEYRKNLGKQALEDAIKQFRYTDKVDQHLLLYEDLKAELKV